MNKREIGTAYEKMAGRFLEKQDYQIVEYNYHCRNGEIDIIARNGHTLIFVEVKYRQNTRKGFPAEAVGDKKQKTICKCALYYLTITGTAYEDIRFDVIGILNNQIEWIQNAFEFQY